MSKSVDQKAREIKRVIQSIWIALGHFRLNANTPIDFTLERFPNKRPLRAKHRKWTSERCRLRIIRCKSL